MKRTRQKTIAWSLAAALVLVAAASALADTPNLAQHWKFDGGWTNEVSSYDADPLWSTVSAGADDGIDGGAAYFDGQYSFLLAEGRDVLPAGAFTFSFWEKGEAGGNQDRSGYYVSDAAMNPLDNLYLRRYRDGEESQPNGDIADNHFAETGPDIPIDEWHHHTVTYTAAGMGRWYVDGALATQTINSAMPFGGLTEKASPSGFEGLVLGNNMSETRPYKGYLDDFQIYDGSVTPGMAEYLHANPGQTLTGYVPPQTASLRRWLFDGDLNEVDGTHHGTALGGAVAGADDGAYAGSGAVYFDGDNDAVAINSEVLGEGPFSIAFWSKTHADGSKGYIVCDSENYNNLFMRRFDSETGNSTYDGWVSGVDSQQFGPDGTMDTAWPLDTWHHQVLSVDEDGYLKWYVNGALRKEVATETPFGGLTSDLYLGNRANLERDFKGWLDDLQIYGSALSAEDAAFLYNNPGSTLAEVPEPNTLVLLASALVGLAVWRRRFV